MSILIEIIVKSTNSEISAIFDEFSVKIKFLHIKAPYDFGHRVLSLSFEVCKIPDVFGVVVDRAVSGKNACICNILEGHLVPECTVFVKL